jgi:Uma2 family endonuclease
MTPEEYLAFDRASEVSHEFVNGEIRAMTGRHAGARGHPDADRSLLIGQLRGTSCEAMGHVMRVRVPVGRDYVYPDVVVACGGTKLEDDEHDILLNPVLVVEVLSPSTAHYDRGEKWEMYRRIPTLKEYLLVSQKEPKVERYTRFGEQGLWLFGETSGLDASIELESIGCVLQMADIYERVFPVESTEASSTQEAS